MKLTMWRVVVVLDTYTRSLGENSHFSTLQTFALGSKDSYARTPHINKNFHARRFANHSSSIYRWCDCFAV